LLEGEWGTCRWQPGLPARPLCGRGETRARALSSALPALSSRAAGARKLPLGGRRRVLGDRPCCPIPHAQLDSETTQAGAEGAEGWWTAPWTTLGRCPGPCRGLRSVWTQHVADAAEPRWTRTLQAAAGEFELRDRLAEDLWSALGEAGGIVALAFMPSRSPRMASISWTFLEDGSAEVLVAEQSPAR